MLVAAGSTVLSGLLWLFAAAPASASFIAPETAHSPNADDITTTYWVVLIVTGALALAINVALVMAVMRFRARRGADAPARVQSGPGLQTRLLGGLGVLALALFIFGAVMTERTRDIEPSGPNGLQASLSLSAQTQPLVGADLEPLEIRVVGQRWLWRFEYPGGREGDLTFSYEELVVPVDTTVLLHVTSTDVLHRWWVPALGGKVDAVPGQTQDTWFKADEVGVYEGQSAAFSGPSYPTMHASVRVVTPQEYEAWLTQQAADLAEAQAAVKAENDAAAAEEIEEEAGEAESEQATGTGTETEIEEDAGEAAGEGAAEGSGEETGSAEAGAGGDGGPGGGDQDAGDEQ